MAISPVCRAGSVSANYYNLKKSPCVSLCREAIDCRERPMQTYAVQQAAPSRRQRPVALALPSRSPQLEDVEMDTAAIDATHSPVLASGAAPDHAEHREIALAFPAFRHHRAVVNPRPRSVFNVDH